jgi:hypothetical protein
MIPNCYGFRAVNNKSFNNGKADDDRGENYNDGLYFMAKILVFQF